MAAPETPPTADGQQYTDPQDGSRWVAQNGQWVPLEMGQRSGGAGAVVAGVTEGVLGGILKNTGNRLRNGLNPIAGNNMSAIGSGVTNAAAGLNEQSAEHDKQSARLKADAQRGYQIGNRDERVEAMKDAAAKEAHTYDTKVNQMDAATGSGTAAFLAQNTQQGDIQSHRQRSDQQRAHGEDLMLKGEDATQVAIQERTAAKEADRQYRDVEDANEAREEIQPPPEEDELPPDEDPPDPDVEDPPDPDAPPPKKEDPPEPPPPEPKKEEPPPQEKTDDALIRVRNALGEIYEMRNDGKLTEPKDLAEFEQLADEGELLSSKAEDDEAADESWDKWAERAEQFIMAKTGKTREQIETIKRAAGGKGGRKLSDTGAGGEGAGYGKLIDKNGKTWQVQTRGGQTIAKAQEAINAGIEPDNVYVLDMATKNFVQKKDFTGSDIRIKKVKGIASDRRVKRLVPILKRRFD